MLTLRKYVKKLIKKGRIACAFNVFKRTKNKKFKDHIYKRTNYLDELTLQRDLSQRIYHYINNCQSVPVDKHGWYYDYIGLAEGYSKTVRRIPEYNRIEQYNSVELHAIVKSVVKLKTLKRYKYVQDYLIAQTEFLNHITPNLQTRLFFFKNDIKELITLTNSDIPKTGPSKRIIDCYKTHIEFENKSEEEKQQYLRNWLGGEDRERYTKTIQNKSVLSIVEYINAQLHALNDNVKYNQFDTTRKLYHVVHKLKEIPQCTHCKSVDAVFSYVYNAYATTCSHECNNKCRENIEKRIKNNGTNSHGYKTNVGRNENYILQVVSKRLNLPLTEQQVIKGFVADGVNEETKTIVEVTERHHLWNHHFEKDKIKYKVLINAGYNIIVVFDTLKLTNIRQSAGYKNYISYFKQKFEDKIKFYNITVPEEKILTGSGFDSFIAITESFSDNLLQINFANSSTKLTEDHKVYCNGEFVAAAQLAPGNMLTTLNDNNEVVSVEKIEGSKVYDVVETRDNTFYFDNIFGHNCLFIDEADWIECVQGSTIVTINDGTHIKDMQISSLIDQDCNNYEVLTPTGFKKFKQCQKYTNRECVKLIFDDASKLVCSKDHEILLSDGEFELAHKLIGKVVQTQTGNKCITAVNRHDSVDLFDLTDVEGGVYYTNGVASHNCNMLSEFWASVYPIISASKKAKIVMASTPRDTSGLFYKLYQSSLQPKSAWKSMKITWDQVPGRDEQWRQDTIQSLSDPSTFSREFECVAGNTQLDIENANISTIEQVYKSL